jgi:beta-phosphoglucomutase
MIRSAVSRTHRTLAEGVGLVFDLDGVIVDSNRVHSACWREYLKRHGLETPPDFDERMFGRHNSEIVRLVFGEDLDAGSVRWHGAEKEKLYREMMAPVLSEYLVPGVVSFLHKYSGSAIALATNAEPANAAFILNKGDLGSCFRFVINGAQVSRPKPDPEIYLRAADALGIPPADCIIFEDSKAGVEAARAAGARVVAVETTHRGDELAPVDLSIRDFLDPALETWLSSQIAAK